MIMPTSNVQKKGFLSIIMYNHDILRTALLEYSFMILEGYVVIFSQVNRGFDMNDNANIHYTSNACQRKLSTSSYVMCKQKYDRTV